MRVTEDVVEESGAAVLLVVATLIDDNEQYIDDLGITTPPIMQAIFDSAVDPKAEDVTDAALPNGAGTDGNQFQFIGSAWRFNLRTSNYTAPGTYTATMKSGDENEFVPTCTGVFVID